MNENQQKEDQRGEKFCFAKKEAKDGLNYMIRGYYVQHKDIRWSSRENDFASVDCCCLRCCWISRERI
jgi:hypothetical protein